MSEIRIRPYAPTDVERLHAAIIDSWQELALWMPWCHPNYAIEETRNWVEEQVKNFEAKTEFEMCIMKDDELIGGCGLNHVDQLNRLANLGYWVRTSETKRGIATRAVEQLIEWARKNTNLVRLEIVVATGNAPSNAVARKVGAVAEGLARKRLRVNDVSLDSNIYSIIIDRNPNKVNE